MGAPSRKAVGRIQPGDVRNPKGRNQYTYRREFERTSVTLLDGELKEQGARALPERVYELIFAFTSASH